MRYRARYKDAGGKEVPRAFADKEKSKAQRWLDEVTTSQVTGTYVDPKTARTTVADWCATWLAGYATRRPRTVRQARVHVAQITAAFGPMPLSAVRPSSVRSWTVELKAAGLARQLRVRAALAAVPGHERRRARRAAGTQPVLAPHVTRSRRSAPV